MDQPFLSVIIPAHNEEHRLPETLPKLIGYLQQQSYTFEIVVVENGSHDQTYQVGLEFSKIYPNVSIIHLEESGKGLAIQHGIRLTSGTYRFIADADFSMPVEEIEKFLPPNSYCEINIASREAIGSVRINEPSIRHISGRVYNLLIRMLLLPRIQDTQCGFKCYRSDAAEDIFRFQRLKGWAFDVEILYVAGLRGWKIKEIPIHWYYSSGSKIQLVKDSTRMFADLFTIRRNARMGLYK